MRNRKLLLVTLFMGISITGLLSLQTYWALGIIEENERKFNATVNQSLANVVRYLEKKDIEGRTYDFFISLDTGEASGMNARHWISSGDTTVNTVVTVSSGSSLMVIPENGDNDVVVDIGVDGENQTYTYYESNSGTVDNIISEREEKTIIIKKHIERVQEREELVSEVWEELVVEEINLSERLDSLAVDSFLNQELRENGISIPFFFGITLDEDSLLFSNFDPIKFSAGYFPYEARLFPTDVYLSDSYLGVLFPDKNKFLFRESVSALLTSVVLIIAMGICFWYVARLFLSQKKLNEIKNDFIDNMTHELKTPLTNISLASQSLKDDKLSRNDEMKSKYLDIIDHESGLLLSQVEGVLELKNESWKGSKLHLEDIDLSELIDACFSELELKALEKNASMENLVASGVIFRWDRDTMKRICGNLIDNAIKFGQEGLKFAVSHDMDDTSIRLIFSDDGPGIPRDYQAMVFEKFFRVPTGNVQNTRGSGLGLSYVRNAIDQMEGRLVLHSEEGKGTRIVLTLPKKASVS